MSSISLKVGTNTEPYELSLADSATLPDFAEEVDALLDSSDGNRGFVRLLFNPPFASGISARSGFKAVVDAWLALEQIRRPSVECLVASELVADALHTLLPGRGDTEVRFDVGSMIVAVSEGDITTIDADAIVNASNTALRLGGGVSAAIRAACGPGLAAEMAAIAHRRPLADGDAVVTDSHGLGTARQIIHAASASGDDEAVARSLRNVLRLCVAHHFKSVALPALGTGTGGMPIEQFVQHLARECRQHVEAGATYPSLIRVVLYRKSDCDKTVQTLDETFSRSVIGP